MGLNSDVFSDLFIYSGFNLMNLRTRKSRIMGEIEAQSIRGHQRTGLFHMIAEGIPQRGMEKMGGSMIPAYGLAALSVDRRLDGFTDLDIA